MILTKGFHKHHIKPRYAGGDDSPENLVLLHPIDHAIAHLVQYKMFGNIRDKWASNWLQGIVDPDVYTQFSIDREKYIKEKRTKNSNFDEHMRTVRSNATKNRKEGYQAKAGKEFKERMKTDFLWANKISDNRKKANLASVKTRRNRKADTVEFVRSLRGQGTQYKDISAITGYSMGMISNIIKGKSHANLS